LPSGTGFNPRQPLALWFLQQVYDAWGAGRVPDAAFTLADAAVQSAIRCVQVINIACGVVFVVLAVALGRVLRRAGGSAGEMWLTALVLCTQGYTILFYGYLETYALAAVCIGACLYTGLLAARGRCPVAVPLLVFVVALGLHLSSLAMVPALAVLVYARARHANARRGLWRDGVIAVAGLVLLDRFVASQSGGAGLWAAVRGIWGTATTDQGTGSGLAYLLSARHFRDFFNAQFLIGPWAAALFGVGFVAGVRKHRTNPPGAAPNAALWFAAALAAGYFAASFITVDPALGYARDWDLFAPAGVAYTVAGLAWLLPALAGRVARTRVLIFLTIASLAHTAAWAWLNHSEPRAMARFEHLPLGAGRVEVVMGNWHRRWGRTEESMAWLRKATVAEPRNSNAWALLGQEAIDRGDMAACADAFAHAVALRPDKVLYRNNLVTAYKRLGRFEAALPHYEILCRAEPRRIEYWTGWANAFLATNRPGPAAAVIAQARPLFEAFLAQMPDHEMAPEVRALLEAADRGLAAPAPAAPPAPAAEP